MRAGAADPHQRETRRLLRRGVGVRDQPLQHRRLHARTRWRLHPWMYLCSHCAEVLGQWLLGLERGVGMPRQPDGVMLVLTPRLLDQPLGPGQETGQIGREPEVITHHDDRNEPGARSQ